jgi:hypothetical protein
MSGEAWREAQRELDTLRAEFTPTTGTLRVRVRMTAAGHDVVMSGRGAIAQRPPNDLRMVLLGPGGMTALDLLVRGDRWRFAIPARDQLWTSEQTSKPPRGLPVSFLRWWLLQPLSGRLLSVHNAPEGTVFVLREADATVRVQRRGEGLRMDRKSPSGTERMEVSGPGCSHAVYEHVEGRVRVAVWCEEAVEGAVEERAFEAR